jgi:predicted small metal-binding protein
MSAGRRTFIILPRFPKVPVCSAERHHLYGAQNETEEIEMRLFECGTLVPGCAWHTRADNDAEVVRRAVDHMKTAHGETIIRENMIDNIKARIRNEANAA